MRRALALSIGLLAACGGDERPAAPSDAASSSSVSSSVASSSSASSSASSAASSSATGMPPVELPWSDQPCDGVTATNDWSASLATWSAHGAPRGSMVLTGSSSIRRWPDARRVLAAHGPIQRGLGGAWLADLATTVDSLVLAHQPTSVVLYAGTNDLAGGATVDDVVRSYRCFVQRVFDGQGPTPIAFIAITPNPARWSDWARAEETNDLVANLAEQHPALHFIDVATPFLAQGAPPPASLFVSDELHLSPAGYALWSATIVDALVDFPTWTPPASTADGTWYARVDLGPSNSEDGAQAPAIDGLGIHWNSWHAVEGDAQVLAGDVLRNLVTTTGVPTGIDLVVAGGFRTNGFANGGLTNPDGAHLGTLALGDATGDFFWTGGADDPGALSFDGLDPSRRYTLRLFASRSSSETRVTRYTVRGAAEATTTLTTSGAAIGASGGDGNDDTVAVLTDLEPDPSGQLHLDVAIETGTYAYLSLLELEAQAP